MIKGIDISHWNRVKDFFEVKTSGIDFVILKAGGSDAGFYTGRQNWQGCLLEPTILQAGIFMDHLQEKRMQKDLPG